MWLPRFWFCCLGLALLIAGPGSGYSSAAAAAATPAEVRVGVLKFGTVNWELDVVRRHGLDAEAGIALRTVELIGKDGTAIALQSGAVDVIATDWLWVSRRRATGSDVTFVPHSLAAGGIMVPAGSPLVRPQDLAGKRLGVAGGPVDKSWLFLRAYGLRVLGLDFARVTEPVFAAPPLLNQSLLRGELPAVLNFWHYNARAAAAGAHELISVATMLRGLGLDAPPPILGWVFSTGWAARNPAAIAGFLRATRAAETILTTNDAEWQRLRPQTGAGSDAELRALMQAYRRDIVLEPGPEQQARAAKAFEILAAVGGAALVGPSPHLTPGTFWDGARRQPGGE